MDKPLINTSNPYKNNALNTVFKKSVFFGEVISISDQTDGGRIKVRISGLDNQISNDKLSWSYPLLPKFFHVYPQVGEIVRIILENTDFPQRGRLWIGSIVSQLQKVGYDSLYTALSTTEYKLIDPEPSIKTYPDADGVFPTREDIGIIGKVNTDIILRVNEVHIRAGKHENNNVFKLNIKNPAQISLVYEPLSDSNDFESRNIIMADKIALISHNGIPQFKAARLEKEDRDRIFDEAHPIARGDILVEALNIIRNALINHIHGYSNKPADKNDVINKLEKMNLDSILQNNIVVN